MSDKTTWERNPFQADPYFTQPKPYGSQGKPPESFKALAQLLKNEIDNPISVLISRGNGWVPQILRHNTARATWEPLSKKEREALIDYLKGIEE